MATGHYARVRSSPDGGTQLIRAADPSKDQSYVLSVLNQAQLSHAMFPIGELTKSEVRVLAKEYDLPVADRADSQDLCFVTDGDYRSFLSRNSPEVIKPGEITNQVGEVLGQHQGLAFYTIGQRRGIGIAADQPYFVIEKDAANNQLIVGHRDELGRKTLQANQVNWIGLNPPQGPIRASVKIRYQARETDAVISQLSADEVDILFDDPVDNITPGQMAVFYNGELCLGGGIITNAK